MPAPTDPVAPAELTSWLRDWSGGDASAFERLAPVVYDELRRIARQRLGRERSEHTLEPTALVNEAFLVLAREPGVAWQDRAHFFALASRLMRRILIDYARGRAAAKREGSRLLVALEVAEAEGSAGHPVRGVDLLALDQALDRLAERDEEQARMVEMRFFGGLSIDEMAEVLATSAPTVKRRLRSARAFLYHQLQMP